MKILLICENYYPHHGGAELLFRNLAERFAQRGHAVKVLTHRLPGTPKEENLGAVQVCRVRSLDSRYLFPLTGVWQALRLARKCDVIQTTSFSAAPLAWLVGKICRKPVVITVHEVWAGRWREVTGFPAWKSALHELLEKAIYLLPYKRYVCVSEATKGDLLRLGIPSSKVLRIYNGFEVPWRELSAAEVRAFRAGLGINGDPAEKGKPKFLFFAWGRPGPSKGFETLTKAFRVVAGQLPNAHLLLMLSTGTMHEERRKSLQHSLRDMHERVTFIEPVPEQELGACILAADGVVIPSLSEGFGYAALEAISLGVPVVVSNAGSLPEVVGGRHLIFEKGNSSDLADKMVRLAQGECRSSARKNFPWEETVEGYLALYNSLLKIDGT